MDASKIRTVLLDMDGTILNSEQGIVSCVQYALSSIGIHEEDRVKLRCFIGPPLRESFQKYYHVSAKAAEELLMKYRERYEPVGSLECEIYPGVREFLDFLREGGYRIAVSSSKPEKMCRKILHRFGMEDYFDEIVGATPDGRIDTKLQVLEETFRRMGKEVRKEAVLIGDTRYDAIGGAKAGIGVIGITYGFGTRSELEAEGAVVFDTLLQVQEFLSSGNKGERNE